MEARGRRNLERKSTRMEPTASSEGGGHSNDQFPSSEEAPAQPATTGKRNDKNHQILATKPTAEDEAAEPSVAGKKEKRKRVVIDRKPQGLIDSMIVHSTAVYEIPDEELARCSEQFRTRYARIKARRDKWTAHEQALIDQYLINGYAESAWEVTDDEDDDDGTAEKDRN